MKFTHLFENGIAKFTLEGDLLGAQDSLELLDVVNDHINSGHLKAIVDIKNVRYMNSSGLGVLITIYTKFKNRNGEAIILNPSDQILKLLSMTKLDSVMLIFKDEALATSKLSE